MREPPNRNRRSRVYPEPAAMVLKRRVRARFYHYPRGGRHTFPTGFIMEPSLFLPKTFPTTAGLRLAFHPAPLVIPRDPAAALLFAAHMDRRADVAMIENRPDVADRCAHAAYEARRRAEGVRP